MQPSRSSLCLSSCCWRPPSCPDAGITLHTAAPSHATIHLVTLLPVALRHPSIPLIALTPRLRNHRVNTLASAPSLSPSSARLVPRTPHHATHPYYINSTLKPSAAHPPHIHLLYLRATAMRVFTRLGTFLLSTMRLPCYASQGEALASEHRRVYVC